MKIAALLMLGLGFTASASAAKNCRIASTVFFSQFHCELYSTRFDVADEEACRQLAQSTRESKWFGILEKKERVLATRFTFKTKNRKIKERIIFEEDFDDLCNQGPVGY